ncbi:MAG: RNA 2',3'-cyclic phosphodiesterase, partial [Actinomycetota bacterium]|nr:RNA 2',3'-cyclic phosphodiesterase [Actinomycetota bacterium]
GVRWVPKDNLHVTVKFLGRDSEMIVPGLLDNMGKIKELLPLSLIVGGIGGFPSSRSAKVIWVGTEDSKEKLRKIYKILEKELENYGIEKEGRKFMPHITIGRSREPVNIPVDKIEIQPLEFIVREIALYESILKPGGALYSIIGKVGSSEG